MVSKDSSSFSLPNPNAHTVNSPTSPFPSPHSSQVIGSSIMASDPMQHVSPYGPPAQGNSQPYGLPQPVQSQQQVQEGQTSNQYPQYSYDIRLRYPQDTSRSYPPPPAQPQSIQLPPMTVPGQENGDHAAQSMNIDTTGQIAPVGVKPRVTATLWEDEGTLCFQVDVKGTCVARREGRHFHPSSLILQNMKLM